ncbi:hypothetical protein IFM89_037250 [Coptis chinensis]|uniref:Crossover junction endonuclease MUS81 n=1 Tax=Coptis chinensis TaxID=261450 RepID=A0A835I930_9MAGN|nr:hypothetical protein IFM89_037250 [Coptis chinensis]
MCVVLETPQTKPCIVPLLSTPKTCRGGNVLEENVRISSGGARHGLDSSSSAGQCSFIVRRLPVGDAIWIARHRELGSEYVLDFIVERKGVDDLHCSIKDNRYRDQKLRLVRCGLQKLIYVVEGDPNACDAAETIKTACFTTEFLEGFDVQRTSGLGDTIRKYGHLTLAIAHHYRALVFDEKETSRRTCPSFDEFIKKCQDIEKVTDGDIRAQEEMLVRQSNKLIGRGASKNIFKLVWGG